MVVQQADGILVAALVRGQQEIRVDALLQPVNAEARFQGERLAEHHVLPVQRFHAQAGLVVHADRTVKRLGGASTTRTCTGKVTSPFES